MKTLLRDGWEFSQQPLTDEAGAVLPAGPWQAVTVPHDWLIWDTKNLYKDSWGWYRRTFEAAPGAEVTILYFEGVYMDATVYVNGREVGEWKYGYQTFSFDVTDYMRPGENELWVRVCHRSPNSRWYSGAGIFRPVYQISKKRAHFLPDRIAVGTAPEGEGFRLNCRAAVTQPGRLRFGLYDAEGRPATQGEGRSDETVSFVLPRARRWSVSDPYLYTLRAELWDGETLVDAESFKYGFRTWRFDPDEGFFLNDEQLKIKGVCLHHDLGLLGAAYHTDAARRQLLLMREMGVNAVRTSHNMPAPDFLDLCDELGLLVMDELLDMWRLPKTTYDYARFFAEWIERDVAGWIRRDRRHPAVVMWSIGNEIYDTHEGPEGLRTMTYLMDLLRRHDPEGHAAVTLGSNFMAGENTQKCADVIKLIGYNYSERLYAEHHKKHPDWQIYGSETCSTLQSRGIYHFPYEQPILTDDDLQCSSLGNTTTGWGAKNIPFVLEFEAKTPYSAGQFIWTGIDYIGEPTPYQTKNSYFGMADTACFPKDAYYLFQAAWRDPEEKTVLHLYPYWDWNPGQMIDLLVASNAAEVEVLVNGRSLGRQTLEARAGKVLAHFKAAYEPGCVEAIAYDAEGGVLARDRRCSFGDAVKLCLEAEKTSLAPGQLAYVTISACDKDGVPVANANNELLFELKGPGQLLGLDNGDSADDDPYKTNQRRLFSGKLLAMIEPWGEGEIELKVTSPGLETGRLTLYAQAGAYASPTLPQLPQQKLCPAAVPVRKLELESPLPPILGPEQAEFTLKAKVFPAEAVRDGIDWRVTNVRGADSLIAKGRPDPADPLKLQLKVAGDGDFTVRCLPKNGREHYAFISSLNFKAQGFGQLQLDPYHFVAAAFLSAKGGEIGSGIEQGIATAPDGASWIAFENLNFGSFGSDLLRCLVFSPAEKTHYKIYAGLPGEADAELLLDEVRVRPSRWNTYQEEVFRLPKRLKGLRTLSLALEQRVHIKGFVFAEQEKAWAELRAAEAEEIYGDRFSKEAIWVRHIGNNVSLNFGELDFGPEGTEKIRLCASSALPKNSIHLLFEGDAGSQRELLEFTGPAEEKTAEFSFAPKYGKQQVSLLFLPGTELDLKSIRFLPRA